MEKKWIEFAEFLPPPNKVEVVLAKDDGIAFIGKLHSFGKFNGIEMQDLHGNTCLKNVSHWTFLPESE